MHLLKYQGRRLTINRLISYLSLTHDQLFRYSRLRAVAFFLLLIVTNPIFSSNPGPEAPGKLVEANGVLNHIFCTGQGQPTILLEAGLGGNSLEWHPVQTSLAKHSRVCSYDRPGYGWSEIATSPRNARTISRELQSLLEATGESGPYILVGHSFGGHIVRLYANEFSESVAGIVLLDASHERLFDFLKTSGSSMLVTIKAPQFYQPTVPVNLPVELKPTFKRLVNRSETKETVQNETFYFRRSAEEVKWFPSLPTVPVSVISRGNAIKSSKDSQSSPDSDGKESKSSSISKRWMTMQRDLHRRLSDSKHIIAAKSGHFPHLDEPTLVAEAILSIVQKIRAQR
ncbi:MAG: alpha/beta hydrolase [Acidiferrobacterales bacterium]|nr:alpha/beta hydrolase [Acidiferrobacterales bacterium]